MKSNPLVSLPGLASTSAQWIEWHKSLKSMFGIRTANQVWLYAWSKRKSDQANDGTLRNYMDKQGVKIKSDGILEQMSDTIGGVFSAIGNVLKIGGVVVGILIAIPILVGIVFIISAFRNPNMAARTLSLVTPQGRAISAASSLSNS